MEEIQKHIIMLPAYFELLCQLIGAVALLATVVVRITPDKGDDKKLSKVLKKVLDLASWLPTIGVNPRTKKVEEALQSLKQ